MRKAIFSLIIGLVLFIIMGSVSADTFKINCTSNYKPIPGSKGAKPVLYYSNGGRIPFVHNEYYILTTKSGNSIFCLEPEKEIYCTTYKEIGAYNACGIVAGLNNGSISLSDLDLIKAGSRYDSYLGSRYVTAYKNVQNKIWEYRYDTSCASYSILNKKTYSASLELSKETDLTLSGNYYVSKLNVSKNGLDSYNVSLGSGAPAGTIITESATSTTNVTKSSSSIIYVKVPKANMSSNTNFNVNVSGTYTKETYDKVTPKITKYQYSSAKQAVGLVTYTKESVSTPASLSKSVNLSFNSGYVKINKVNGESKTALTGAKFGFYTNSTCQTKAVDMNGKTVSEVVSNANGEVLFNKLLNGTYYVKETEAPSGYTLDSTCRKANYNGTITVENSLTKGKVTLHKIDGESKKALSGAKFALYTNSTCQTRAKDVYGKTVNVGTTNASGDINFTNLAKGTYYVKETEAPSGYKLDSTCRKANYNGTITLTNKLKTGTVVVKKVNDRNITEVLSGAKFSLTKDSGEKTILVTDESGIVKFTNLAYGKYTLVEEEAPEGYIKDTKSREIVINDKNLYVDYSTNPIKNTPIGITLRKVDFKTNKDLAGAKIIVQKINSNKTIETIATWDTSKEQKSYNLKVGAGEYYISEVSSPLGYSKINYTLLINISKDGKIVSKKYGHLKDNGTFVENKNDEDETLLTTNNYSVNETTVIIKNMPFVKISKQDITSKNEIEGAKITITNTKNNKVIEFISKNTPTMIELPYLGKNEYYYMQEVISPIGYKKINTVFEFQIDENGKSKLISVGKFDSNGKYVKETSSSDLFNTDGNSITLLNEPIVVKFVKVDSVSLIRLNGAHIVIKDDNKNIIKEFDSTQDVTELFLEAGIYYLTETVPPEGYEITNIEYKFEVLDDGTIKLLSEDNSNIKINDDEIILFNSLVYIPNTGINDPNVTKTATIGTILLFIGSYIISFVLNRKKGEKI